MLVFRFFILQSTHFKSHMVTGEFIVAATATTMKNL